MLDKAKPGKPRIAESQADQTVHARQLRGKRIVATGQKIVRIVDTSVTKKVSPREVADRLGARVVGKVPK